MQVSPPNKIDVSITIPIYNEEAGIADTVTHLVGEFSKHNVRYELVLVNHGSTDKTDQVLAKLAEDYDTLNVINLPINLGYGGGIMYGFEHSKGEYVGWTCADEEVSSHDVFRIYDALRNGSFDVSKSRRMQRKDGTFRKFMSFFFNMFIRIRFNVRVKDVNGYPIFIKRALYPSVKAEEKTYMFNLDLLKRMQAHKYQIIEIPIIHRERKKGRSFMKMSRIFHMALGFFQFALKI
jgi:glycosyltransferase involved in cell wall biosynthesis